MLSPQSVDKVQYSENTFTYLLLRCLDWKINYPSFYHCSEENITSCVFLLKAAII
jgi:hypothetical protein